MFSLFRRKKECNLFPGEQKALIFLTCLSHLGAILDAVLLELNKFRPEVVYDKLKVCTEFVYLGK